ncbi:hypothetical protein GCM10008014_12650 [Paenibacillus silvae]|uniref:Uncharacterized protein n=1 Tax=Paenibacillus silvae TaxID=1325358 RepID=A0ABQ1Z6E9_9BACL|nr:hypothetical protein GCM10008014_12650 [Paenibacillus silvae]
MFTGPGEIDMDNEKKHIAMKRDMIAYSLYSLSGITIVHHD